MVIDSIINNGKKNLMVNYMRRKQKLFLLIGEITTKPKLMKKVIRI